MKNVTLKSPCWWIEDGAVREGTLADLARFIETTTRPTGIGYKYYVRALSPRKGDERLQGAWALAEWVTWAGPEVIVRVFDTEEAANAAAEATYVDDIRNNREVAVFLTREEADSALADLLGDERE